MPVNKSYATRERELDKLLQREQGATIKEMQETVNRVLQQEGFPIVSAQNTILNDLENIGNRYKQGIEEIRDSYDRRTIRYRYENRDFSIFKVELSDEDFKHLNVAKDILARFQGLMPAGWLDEFDVRLRSMMINDNDKKSVIGFDTDPKYKGNRHLMPLYDAIIHQQAITITYAPFGYEPKELTVSPYFIRQSGHFWYLIAAEAGLVPKTFGLDRISDIRKSESEFHPCEIDLDGYFSKRVGVAGGSPYATLQTITFAASEKVWDYLEMAPIHNTQTVVGWTETGQIILQIEVCPTDELVHELSKYGEGITVLEPFDLRLKVAQSFAGGIRNYGYHMDIDSIVHVINNGSDSIKMLQQSFKEKNPETGKMMKVLNLAISKEDYDSILDGSKTEETREVKPNNAKRYIDMKAEGYEKKNREHKAVPIRYDAIQFVVYDHPDRQAVIVELVGTDINMAVNNQDGTIVTYDYLGEKWVVDEITYHLGRILSIDENGCINEEEQTK